MQTKSVFLGDVRIGEAASWSDVHALLKSKGVRFIGELGVAEGPTAFYVSVSPAKSGERRSLHADERA